MQSPLISRNEEAPPMPIVRSSSAKLFFSKTMKTFRDLPINIMKLAKRITKVSLVTFSFFSLIGNQLLRLRDKIFSQKPLLSEEIIRQYEQGRRVFRNIRVNGDLKHAILLGIDLSHSDLRRVDLTNANLSGANLKAAKFDETKLHNTNLSRSILTDVDLASADIHCINLSYIDLRKTNIKKRQNDEEDQSNDTDLSKINLIGADLSFSCLANADLTNANLEGANLTGVDFEKTNLTHFHFKTKRRKSAFLNMSSDENKKRREEITCFLKIPTSSRELGMRRRSFEKIEENSTVYSSNQEYKTLDLTHSHITSEQLKYLYKKGRRNFMDINLSGENMKSFRFRNAFLMFSNLNMADLTNATN